MFRKFASVGVPPAPGMQEGPPSGVPQAPAQQGVPQAPVQQQPGGSITSALALLMAMYMMYQHAHWTSKGPLFYMRHDLFARLYGSVSKDTDPLAEKIVGMVGSEALQISALSGEAAGFLQGLPPGQELQSGLSAEESLQNMLAGLINAAKSGQFSPGVENLLQQLFDSSETRAYLLKQHLA